MNGSCILNRVVHPCRSGNDLLEIDFCHQRVRRAQHLHTVGGRKQTPSSRHEAELAAICPHRSWQRFGDDLFPFFFTSMIHWVLKSSISSTALQEPPTLQYWHERGKWWDWISMKRPHRLAATYEQLRHHGNRQRRGRFSMWHTWGRQSDYTSQSRLAETNQFLQTP